MRGRKPKLRAVGSGRPSGRCPSAPSWLTPQGRAEWDRSAAALHCRGLLTADTLATFESYCIATGLVRECEEIMARDGRFVVIEGTRRAHPAFRMQAAGMREARLLAAELRMTRRAAPDDGAEEKEDADAWPADLLA